jgi:hypothetical protein
MSIEISKSELQRCEKKDNRKSKNHGTITEGSIHITEVSEGEERIKINI